MDCSEYGSLLATQQFDDYIRHIFKNDLRIYVIDVYSDHNKVKIEGAADLSWTDTELDKDTFKRVIGKNTLYIRNGEVIVREKQLSAKPFAKGSKDKVIASNDLFMTMDIETVSVKGNVVPYLACAYNKGNYIEVFTEDVLDRNSRDEMFRVFIGKLTQVEGIKYAHNLSSFDGVFLLNYLVQYPNAKVDPVMYNGKLIAIKFTYLQDNKPRTITFKDSYLMLPLTLRTLCEHFDVTSVKTHFPFKLTDINYSGAFPAFSLWTDIKYEEYRALRKGHGGVWDFKIEASKYCRIDCMSLHQIITQFNELFFNQFGLNIHKSLTLPYAII